MPIEAWPVSFGGWSLEHFGDVSSTERASQDVWTTA